MPDTQGVRKRARRNTSASPSAQDGGEASASIDTTSLLNELPLDLIVLIASYFSMKD